MRLCPAAPCHPPSPAAQTLPRSDLVLPSHPGCRNSRQRPAPGAHRGVSRPCPGGAWTRRLWGPHGPSGSAGFGGRGSPAPTLWLWRRFGPSRPRQPHQSVEARKTPGRPVSRVSLYPCSLPPTFKGLTLPRVHDYPADHCLPGARVEMGLGHSPEDHSPDRKSVV